MTATGYRPSPRTVAGIFAKAAAALLLALVLAVAGALVWLRTDSAARFIADTTADALKGMGLRLDIRDIKGPLPGRLAITGLVLADDAGPLVKADAVTLETNLAALFRGGLVIPLARLDQPEIIRLPALPPDETPPGESGGIPSIPLDIVLDQIAVTGGIFHTDALAPAPGDRGGQANAFPDLLSFSLTGSASLRSRALDVWLSASLHDAREQGINLDLTLASGLERLLRGGGQARPEDAAGEADALDITISAGEGPDGPMAALLGLSGFPGYSLRLSGKGPVHDWKGALRFALGSSGVSGAMTGGAGEATATADKARILAKADFGLQCKTGSVWHDLVAERNFGASLEASFTPGADTPAPLLPVLGDALRLTASLEGKKERLDAAASVDSPALAVRIANASLAPARQGVGQAPDAPAAAPGSGDTPTSGMAAFASLSIHALDMPALLGLAALGSPAARDEEPAPPLPLSALALSADVNALLDGDFSRADAAGTVNAEVGGEAFSIGYAVSVLQKGDAVSLRSLRLDGLGLIAEARGAARADTLAINATANITAADNAPWQKLAARLAGLAAQPDGTPPLGGSVHLAAELDFPGLRLTTAKTASPPVPATPLHAAAPASGMLTVQGRDMRWPSTRLASMLGTVMDARFHLEGKNPDASGLPSEYTLHLEEAAAGVISAQGQARFAPGQGDLLAGVLDASCTARVSDLGAVVGEETSGSFSLTASASGPLNALAIALEADSPAVMTSAGAFKGISLSLTGNNLLEEGGVAFNGAVSAALEDSPGGPVRLGGGIQAHVPPSRTVPSRPDSTDGAPHAKNAEPARARVQNFFMRGAGLSVTADIAAAIPPADGAGTGAPELRGTLNARVDDWSKIAALTGAPFSGDPASLDLRLDNAAHGQSAAMSASLPRLALKEPGQPPALRLQDVTAKLAASDLFGAPSLTLDLGTGKGKAAFLLWNTGEGSIKGSSGTGEFHLSLRQEGGRSRQRSGAVFERVQQERLGLAGRYDLSRPSVILNAFTLRDPRSKTGLDLAKPVTIDLADGIALKDLDVAFLPGGRLTAEAAVTPEAMTARLALAELPFAFFALFTQAALPDGTLSAQAAIRTDASGPSGVFSVDSILSATTDITGISKSGPGTPPGNAGSPALALHVGGKLGSDPGPAVLAGSGVRPLPGRIWLRGDGTFGSAGKADSAREGSLAFQIPLIVDPSGVPSPDGGSPMAAGVRFSGPASVLWQAAPIPDRYLNGQMRVEAGVSGSMNAPRHRVRAYLAEGSFEDVTNGVLVSGINLEAASTEKGDIVARAAASDGRSGTFALQADVTGLQGDGVPNLKVRGQLKEFRPLHRDDLDIVLSGILGVNGPLDSVAVTGTIAVEQGEVVISRLAGGSVPVLEVTDGAKGGAPGTASQQSAEEEPPPRPGPALDIKVIVPQYFHIRGMGLESEWQGDLKITGSASEPSLVGTLNPVRGYFDIFSRTFQFSGGEIAFAGGKEINPALSLELTYEGPDVTALLKTGGTAKAPTISLESRPPLPQDEVLARVLFGKRTSALSRFEAIQLANNMRELTGFGGSGFDMLSGVRKQFGLDMLRVGGGSGPTQRATSGQSGEGSLTGGSGNGENDTGAPTLEAGKYINDSIYVGVEQGATGESTAVRVEVELYPRVMLEGKSSADTSEVGIGWKMDY